jgi:hypothetical protein
MRLLFTALAFIALALPAQASLIGTQVRGAAVNPLNFDLFAALPQPATVTDPGDEFSSRSAVGARVEADVQADRVVLRLVGVGTVRFFPFAFAFDFAPGLVTAAQLVPNPSLAISAGPALVGDRLTVSSAPTSDSLNGTLTATILLTTRTPDAAVPAPGALALLGVALLGLAAVARRRG